MAFAQSAVGLWKTLDDETGEHKSHVKVYEKDGVLYAKITKLLLHPQDTKCSKCTGDRKDAPIVGMKILWGLKKSGSTWKGGRVYDPEQGKDFVAKVWLDKKDPNKLYVRGYLGFLYRTQTWTRVK